MTVEGTARNADGSVRLAVAPGGALRALDIRPAALDLGARHLADTILELAKLATAQANQRATHLMCDVLAGLPPASLAALGCVPDPALVEAVESTTPDTWQDL
jgi:DNA-binding protein YbaB